MKSVDTWIPEKNHITYDLLLGKQQKKVCGLFLMGENKFGGRVSLNFMSLCSKINIFH